MLNSPTLKPLLKNYSPSAGGIINYPSGNAAVSVSKTQAGQQIITCYTDKPLGEAKVLVTFDEHGVGSVSYRNGSPWLIVRAQGWSVSDPKGSFIERGKFPRLSTVPITCAVTDYLTVKFVSRQDIQVSFVCEDVSLQWQCGEQLRRSDSHLDKVLGCTGGKLELDVEKIRARQASVGSLYVPKGPHATATPPAGIGMLRSTLRSMSSEGPLADTIRDLQGCDARVQLIDIIPKAGYGSARGFTPASTARSSTSKQVSPQNTARRLPPAPGAIPASPPAAGTISGSAALQGSLGSGQAIMQATGGSSSSTPTRTGSCPLLPDYGSPQLTAVQRRLQRELGMGPYTRSPPVYKPRRSKLERCAMAAIEQRVLDSRTAEKDLLTCVCILADWNPVCRKVEAQLQEGWGVLKAEAQAEPQGPASRVQLLHVDASEGNSLQQRFGFRSVPMFLMAYQGQLVSLGNNISTAEQLRAACMSALEKGRKGQFLPDRFNLGGRDNALLDYISPGMSLR